MLALGAGIHEGLGDDGERGVHHFRHVYVEDEVWVLENVHPEPQRQAGWERVTTVIVDTTIAIIASELGGGGCPTPLSIENPAVTAEL